MTDCSADTGPPWNAVADLTGIGAGTVVLDVGCGTGAFCELAAGSGAAVHGIDAVLDHVQKAQRRVPDGDFRVGLMEDLPWSDDTFDVVTGFNAFQYALDVDLALAEARRVARPGARIAICKWGRPQDNEFFAFLGALGAAAVGSGRLPATDPVDDAVIRAGLQVVAVGEVSAAMEMADEQALEAALAAAGVFSRLGGEAARRRLAEAASPFRRPDGGYRFENRLRYRIAEK